MCHQALLNISRVRLSKRRSKTGKTANSRLLVKHREFNDAELKQQVRFSLIIELI